MPKAQAKTKQIAGPPVPLWEWLVAALGLLLVVGIIGLLLYEAASRPKTAPDIALEVDAPVKLNSGWQVTIKAVNQGGKTAAQLTIAAELRDEKAQVVETAELTFDYLAPRSSRIGGVYFAHDPSQFQLKVEAKSYIAP